MPRIFVFTSYCVVTLSGSGILMKTPAPGVSICCAAWTCDIWVTPFNPPGWLQPWVGGVFQSKIWAWWTVRAGCTAGRKVAASWEVNGKDTGLSRRRAPCTGTLTRWWVTALQGMFFMIWTLVGKRKLNVAAHMLQMHECTEPWPQTYPTTFVMNQNADCEPDQRTDSASGDLCLPLSCSTFRHKIWKL